MAISYALRAFEDALVEVVPEPEPDLEILVQPGLRLRATPLAAQDLAPFVRAQAVDAVLRGGWLVRPASGLVPLNGPSLACLPSALGNAYSA